MSSTALDLYGFFSHLGDDVEAHPLWPQSAAGCLVLRHAIARLDGRPLGPHAIREIEPWMRRVTDLSEYKRLRTVLNAATDDLARELMIWGQGLLQESLLAPACEVFTAVAQHYRGDGDLVASALLERARCLRRLGHYEDARCTYSKLTETANRLGDFQLALRSRLYDAATLSEAGEIENAETEIRAVMRKAKAMGATELLGMAACDMSGIALALRHDARAAIRFANCAMRWLEAPDLRERVAINLAYAQRSAGLTAEAIRTADTLLKETRHADHRVRAMNLRRILAIDTLDWPTAKSLRRRLAHQTIPATLECDVLAIDGYAAMVQGDPRRAILLFERARVVGEAAGQGSVAAWCTHAITDATNGTIPAIYGYRAVTPSSAPMSLMGRIGRYTLAAARDDAPIRAGVVASGASRR